ncbi:MAG: HlyD family secretion protein [Defluviitaleaceae bacterium]|nr:HlyD family secretion protein [Defluviitaleaceae bacterium]
MVTADGLIESAQKTEVYAPSNLRVQEVLVQEGDPVESGEVLAELDTEALSLAIRRAELSIQNAEANLSNEQTALLNTITNSRNSLDSAAVSLQTAQREYDTLLAQKGREPAVISAAINLDTAKRAWENNQALYGTGGISAEALTQTKDALDKAQSAYDDAMRAASDALNRASETLAAAKIRQKNANDVLSDAVAQNTDPAAASVELQKVALEEKQIQLRDARICAPAAGRVTLVQAKVGAPASGLLFIIEDDQQLIVRARVEEADVASLAVGMPCRIQPIGQEGTLEGVVTLVPPAAERDESGVFKAAVGDDAYFAVEVSITSTEPGVLIGMNAEVSLIVAARSDCFSAPKALVYHDEQHSWVLTRSKSGKIMEVPVQTGIESSQMTEIISDALYEGMELFSR